LLLVLASKVTLGTESHETHDHILLSLSPVLVFTLLFVFLVEHRLAFLLLPLLFLLKFLLCSAFHIPHFLLIIFSLNFRLISFSYSSFNLTLPHPNPQNCEFAF
jgi:hypothetical protein